MFQKWVMISEFFTLHKNTSKDVWVDSIFQIVSSIRSACGSWNTIFHRNNWDPAYSMFFQKYMPTNHLSNISQYLGIDPYQQKAYPGFLLYGLPLVQLGCALWYLLLFISNFLDKFKTWMFQREGTLIFLKSFYCCSHPLKRRGGVWGCIHVSVCVCVCV